jgi:hypothetical protein
MANEGFDSAILGRHIQDLLDHSGIPPLCLMPAPC